MDEQECGRRFPDDPKVSGDEVLFRRIPPRHFFLDENLGCTRPSSAAFEDDADGDPMSVYLAGVIAGEGRPPDSVLAGHVGFALAGLPARTARDQRQTVHPDGRDDTAHAVVCGPKTSSRRRAFAKLCHWVIPPAKPGE
jgi:hypothetical protein